MGGDTTVTARDAELFGHPPDPVTVYDNVAIPGAIPFINPVAEFIVATVISDEFQAPPAVEDENNVLDPTQILCVPLKVPGLGDAVTVIISCAVALPQPPVPLTV